MSKPRWIDAGVFRALRTATRKRKLAVIVGPRHGTAEISTRAALREALGDGDRASLQDDARCVSEPCPALAMLYRLRQPGLVTTAVSNALQVSQPADLAEEVAVRVFDADGKGLKGAWDRKDPWVARLGGGVDAPEGLVLTNKDRKALIKPDSRYQAFLRATFSRTVVFTGFALDDPDLNELLEDVARVFNGHVPANFALVEAGSTDPATALKASMHYGMTQLEFPAQVGPTKALEQLAGILEELEVPKPATGNPPPGFTELDDAMRAAVPEASDEDRAALAHGDPDGWPCVKSDLDAARDGVEPLIEHVLGDAPENKVPVALVRGASGDGKTTLMRRLAWTLAERGEGKLRVFWRESGSGLPDNYVPAEADDARAVFVVDDAEQLANVHVLLRNLAANGGGKARFVLAADANAWDRSGLDHRIRPHVARVDLELGAPSSDEATRLGEALVAAGRAADAPTATAALGAAEGPLIDRLANACSGHAVADGLQTAVVALEERDDSDLLKKAWLAVALVHQHGMSLDPTHLARALELDPAELQAKVLEPLSEHLVTSRSGALRTPHPYVAAAVTRVVAPEEAPRDALGIALLETLKAEETVEDPRVFHAPSEYIRARRHEPMPPLVLGKFFEAAEESARNDVAFWFDRGRFEAGFSRWEPALAAFDQALWRQPGDSSEREHNAVVHANRARCLQSLSRKKEALAAVEDGLRNSPHDQALQKLQEKLGGRRRGPQRGRGGPGGGRGAGGGRGRGGPGGGRGGPGGGRGGPGGGRGGPGGGRGGPGGGRGGPARPGDPPRQGAGRPG